MIHPSHQTRTSGRTLDQKEHCHEHDYAVLVIERREGKPHVVHYEPGIWEQELEAQAAQRHKETPAPGNGDSAFAVIVPKGRHVLAGEEEAKPVKKKPPLGFLG
jgi:acetylornithine deacetylase/succinyl-diaminopimelate desuccinylase-like protein